MKGPIADMLLGFICITNSLKEATQKNSYQKEKELKKRLNKISKIETQISDLEREISKIDKVLRDADSYEELTSNPIF